MQKNHPQPPDHLTRTQPPARLDDRQASWTRPAKRRGAGAPEPGEADLAFTCQMADELEPAPDYVKDRIVSAFIRIVLSETREMAITTDGGMVTLTGSVASWVDAAEAERAARSVAGVTEVENRIVVGHPTRADETSDDTSAGEATPSR